MGKQKRQKRRSKKTGSDRPKEKSDAVTGPVIVQRIRHSDVRTRHAALTAILGQTKLHTATLQAVRDCLMDKDLDCSILAAQCLVEYLQEAPNMDHQITAGWMVVLVGRLEECTNQPSWLQLAATCIQCIVTLVEVNSVALDRLLPTDHRTPELRNKTFAVLLDWLRRSNETTTDGPWKDIASWTSRFFHSAWDDNPELVLPFIRSEPKLAEAILTTLQQATQSSFPFCRLHSTGTLLSLYSLSKQYPSETSDSLIPKLEAIFAQLIQTLRAGLSWDEGQCERELESLTLAYEQFQREQKDAQMEDDIVSHQNQKQEPARQIARRLKESEEQHSGKLPSERVDYESLYNEQLGRWNERVRCLQLGLEICANFTSSTITSVDDMEEEEEPDTAALDDNVSTVLIDAGIPHQLWSLLRPWTNYTLLVMDDVSESAADIQSKAALCLGHCVSNMPAWKPPATIWEDVQQALTKTRNPTGREGLCACLVMIYNCRTPVLDFAQWEFLLSITEHEHNSSCGRDAIVIVRQILAGSAHPADLNTRVAGLWKGIAANSSAVVLAEILNGFMDIYGDDSIHPAVFRELGILPFFQQTLPTLKQRTLEASSWSDSADTEALKETATNAAAFIQYKKGRL